MICILLNLPEDYEVAVSDLERWIKDTTVNKLYIEEMRTALNSRYQRLEKFGESKEEELALAVFKRQYNGVCGKCW